DPGGRVARWVVHDFAVGDVAQPAAFVAEDAARRLLATVFRAVGADRVVHRAALVVLRGRDRARSGDDEVALEAASRVGDPQTVDRLARLVRRERRIDAEGLA